MSLQPLRNVVGFLTSEKQDNCCFDPSHFLTSNSFFPKDKTGFNQEVAAAKRLPCTREQWGTYASAACSCAGAFLTTGEKGRFHGPTKHLPWGQAPSPRGEERQHPVPDPHQWGRHRVSKPSCQLNMNSSTATGWPSQTQGCSWWSFVLSLLDTTVHP